VPLDLSLPCAAQSHAAEEPIAATALAATDRWLLVEQRRGWARDQSETTLAPGLRRMVDAIAASTARLRVLLVKRPTNSVALPHQLIAVRSGAKPMARRFELDDAEPDAELEGQLRGLLDGNGSAGGGGTPLDRPLLLVCAHGRRDSCCARRGVALYKQLADHPDRDRVELWQSSHQGGHRFAATALLLPHGVHYGRLDAAEADALLRSVSAGRIHDLERYRGNTRYDRAAQAADAWLRRTHRALAFDELQLIDQTQLDESAWRVRMQLGSQEHELRVVAEPLPTALRTSCSAEQPSQPLCYRVAAEP
jgi:hypothetical protein